MTNQIKKRLHPLDPDTFTIEMQQVVRWHLLMNDADTVTREHHLGLANVWGFIRRGEYAHARDALDTVTGQAPNGCYRCVRGKYYCHANPNCCAGHCTHTWKGKPDETP